MKKYSFIQSITPRIALIATLGCLLTVGILFFVLKGNSVGVDTSNRNHPYISEKILKSKKPIKVAPFQEPSLEGLVAQFKTELGLTELEIAETAEMIARDRFIDNLNFMDSRKDADTRHTEWDMRKIMVVAKPELLWTFGFILPPTIDSDQLEDNVLYNYSRKHRLEYSKSQEERMDKLRQQSQDGVITDLERVRRYAAIVAESYPPLTIAKQYHRSGVGSVHSKVGMEYAELAITENPDSFEAHHVLALCNRMYYAKTDREKVIAGFRQLVKRFPNSAIANFELAANLQVSPFMSTEQIPVPPNPNVKEALTAMQRAIQLDPRVETYNEILAACYTSLGQYEKALAVYQGLSEVYFGHGGGLLPHIYRLQEVVAKQRQMQDSH